MSTLGVIPLKFQEHVRKISGSTSKARLAFWKILLFVSNLYSLYINMTLILSFLISSQYEDHQCLGMHIA